MPQEYVFVDKKSISETQIIYLPQQLNQLKFDALGLSEHLRSNIENKYVDLSQLWFANFLESSQSKDGTNVAEVSFLFRVVQRTESIKPGLFDSKLNDYQVASVGRATHLVEQVVYGAECLFSMRRTIKKRETKENVEGSLYLVAEKYFNQIFIRNNSAIPDLPAELNNVECEILSSLDANNQLQGSCQTAVDYLRKEISFKNGHANKWKPIEITLRYIPGQIETLLRTEKKLEVQFGRERQKATLKLIRNKCQNIMNYPALDFVPPFKKLMFQFHGLLDPLWEEIDKFYMIFQTSNSPEKALKEKEISNLLSVMIDWLIRRRFEIWRISLLLKDTQQTVKDWAEIETLNSPHRTKLFVVQAEWNENTVVESILKFIGTANTSAVPLLVLPILSFERERLIKIREKFLTNFADETQSNYCGRNQLSICYHTGFAPKYPSLVESCLITTIENYKKMLTGYMRTDSPMKQQGKVQNLSFNSLLLHFFKIFPGR